jgi:hypothetical protein
VHVLPPSIAADAIRYSEDGRLMLQAFYAQTVRPRKA